MWVFKLFKTFKHIFSGNRWCLCDISNTRFRLWEMTFSFFPFLIYPMQKSSRFCLLINFSCFSKEQARSPPPQKKRKEKTVPTAKTLYLPGKKEGNSHFNSFFWGGNSVGKSKWVPSSSFLPLSFLPIHMAHKGASHTLAQDTSLPTFSHSRRGLRTVILVVVVSTGFRGHMDINNYTLSFARTFWLNDHDRKNFAIF